jgi:hypothetical protein
VNNEKEEGKEENRYKIEKFTKERRIMPCVQVLHHK